MRRNRTVARALLLATLVASIGILAGPASPAWARIKITAAYYDPSPGADPDTNAGRNQEYIVIRNTGTRSVRIGGWKLHDVPRLGTMHTFRFPAFRLRGGHTVRVHTGHGTNTATDLYWGLTYYVWGDDSDMATLLKRSGSTASTCSWGSTDTSPRFC